MPRDDINFKVAIAAGANELEAGQLRKAEEQFRFAVRRSPDRSAGYRGLAKVFIELDDRAGALSTLRDGAQALARAGNRHEAIDLLRDAVRLAPEDLALHRHLAAALANDGDEQAAVSEYERYVALALGRGDVERARLEVAYARETIADQERLLALESSAGGAPVASAGGPDLRDAFVAPAPSATPPAAGAHDEAPGSFPDDPRQRALALEARAQDLLSRHDTGAAAAALEASRALLGEHMEHAAADLLLQVVAAGLPDRDAQRLLVDVAKGLGRGEIARDKCALLAEALRLDGRVDAATEVERLAAV